MKFIDENEINVTDKISEAVGWIKEKITEINETPGYQNLFSDQSAGYLADTQTEASSGTGLAASMSTSQAVNRSSNTLSISDATLNEIIAQNKALNTGTQAAHEPDEPAETRSSVTTHRTPKTKNTSSSGSIRSTTSSANSPVPGPPNPSNPSVVPSAGSSSGTKNTARSSRTRNSISVTTSLRQDRQNQHSESITSNSFAVNDSDDNLIIKSILAGYNPEGYDLHSSSNLHAWAKEVTRYFSPDSWFLLMQYENLPEISEARHVRNMILSMPKPAETFHYLEGNDKIEMIYSMSTNIHEISHGYYRKNVFRHAMESNFLLDSDNATGYIFLSPKESYYIEFPKKSLFPSRELVGRIPRNLQTYRFNTYINGITSTQSEGVFGLLNELHAYYLGSRFDFEMLDGYKIAEGITAEGFYQWALHSGSSMTALFEFDFFILEYLLYMKTGYPHNYSSLKSYQPFHDAYAAVRMKYSDLVLNYLNKIQEEMLNNASGEAVFTIEGNTLWMQKTKTSSLTGADFIFEDMDTLLPILKSDRYSEIEQDFPLAFPERSIYSRF